MTQETLRNPRIHCMGNPQFIRSIVEDICRFVKGNPQNCQRVSAESSKGVRGIVIKGYLRICRRASVQSELSKASAKSRKMILWNYRTVFLD